MIKHLNDLEVYRKSQQLYPQVVEFSRGFPREGFHLHDQMCRSANAIHADVAEGFGRSVAEFKMYLTRALGSCNETVSHINDALNVSFGDKQLGLTIVKKYEVLGEAIILFKRTLAINSNF